MLKKLKIHVSLAFANQPVGLKQIDQGIWQVDFMSYTIGYFDEDSRKFAPNDDPFGLHMSHL